MRWKVAILSTDGQPQFLGGIKRVCSMLGECWMESGEAEVEFITFTESDIRKPMIGRIAQTFFPNASNYCARENVEFLVNKLNGEGFSILFNPHVEEQPLNELVAEVRQRVEAKVVCALHFPPTHNRDVVRESFFISYALGGNVLAWLLQSALWLKYKLYGLRVTAREEMVKHVRTIENCDRFVVLSKHFLPFFPAEVRDKIVSINNPSPCSVEVDAASIEREKRNEVVWCGRMDITGMKRVDRMLRVWKQVGRLRPNWTLRIMGSGDVKLIKNLVARHHIPGVMVEGFCEPWQHYRHAKILCCTSTDEGWGMVLVEAMSRGCVPMAFDSYASVHDIINDGVNGVLVKPFSIGEYSRKLIELIDDDEHRRTMAAQGLESISRFNTPMIARQWLKLFGQIFDIRNNS